MSMDWFFIGSSVVASSNAPPTVAFPIPDQSAVAGVEFSYQFPEATFADDDDDVLSYSAQLDDETALPSWLIFNPTTRTFSGTPTDDDVATLSVRVTATDGTAQVMDVFQLAVSAAEIAADPIDGAIQFVEW